MKKKCLKFLLVCLIFSQFSGLKISAAVDVTKPVFESISIDKTNVKVGDPVTITIKAHDTESGLVESSLPVVYKSPITHKDQWVYLSYNASIGGYEGSIMMKDSMESGEWQIYFFDLMDNAGNYDRITGPIAGSSFTLTGTTTDVTKPILDRISVDKSDVNVGDQVTITIKAHDTESGIVESEVPVIYKSPITHKDQWVYLHYNASISGYEGSITMKDSMESGEWQIYFFDLMDNAGNYDRIMGPVDGSSFTLTGTTTDVTKPILEGINIDKTDVRVGDKVTITIKAKDTESGLVNSSLPVIYKSPITHKDQWVYLPYNASIGGYEGSITMKESMEPGEWQIYFFDLMDNAGNYERFMGPFAGTNFTFHDYTQDHINPTFNSINIDKSTVETNDNLGITVDASDDTLVKSVVVNYVKPISGETESITLSKDSDGLFRNNYYIPSDSEYGEWKVAYAEITDLNNNKTTISIGLDSGNFIVLKPITSLGHKFVMNNESWSNQTINGDVYIGPQAILTINQNVTINGNVYVLGALRSYGGLKINGYINARSFYMGYRYSYFNGDVSLSGSNSIYSMVATTYPLSEVPIQLYDTPLIKEDGKINLRGATIPVVDVYLDNQKLNVRSDGTFRFTDYYVGDRKEITFTFIDVFGNTTYKNYKVYTNDQPVVSIDKPEGIYLGTQYIELSLSKDGKIYYTLDGNDPTSNSAVYSGPITLDQSSVLKFVGEDEIGNKSEIYTKNFQLFKLDEVTNNSKVIKGSGNPDLTVTFTFQDKSYSTVINSDGLFEVEVPNLKDQKTISVVASDQQGNISSNYEIQVKDVIAPQVNGVEQNGIYNSDKTITFNEGTATLNGNPFVSGTTVVTEGSYTLQVMDEAGNITKVNFGIDKTAPTISGVENNKVYNRDVMISFNEGSAKLNNEVITTGKTVSNEGQYSLEVTDLAGNKKAVNFSIDKSAPIVKGIENNKAYNHDVSPTFNEGIAKLNGTTFINGTTVSAEGSYAFEAIDAGGNKTTANFSIDKTAPIVTGVKDQGLYKQDVMISVNEGSITLDGTAFVSGSKVAKEGQHIIIVTDKAGNQTTLTFTIDKTAPTVSGVTNNSSYNKDVTLTFNDGTATLNGNAFTSGTSVTNEGIYKLIVTDKAGNQATINFTIDKTVPLVSGVENEGVYNKEVTITFNEGNAKLNGTEFKSGSIVKTEGTYNLVVKDAAGNQTSVSFVIDKSAPTVSGVTNNASYNKDVTVTFNEGTALLNGVSINSGTIVKSPGLYTLVVTDAAGNKTEIKFTIDKTSPKVTGVVNNAYYNKDVTISFNEGSALLNGISIKSGTIVKTAGTYTVAVTDTAGNKTTVKFTIDKTAPSLPIIYSVTDKSTSVSGKAESNSEVKLYIAGKYFKSVSADRYGNYKFTISKQKAGTEIKVTAKDKAGNISKPKVTKIIDKTPPAVPTVNKVTTKSTYVTGKAENGATVYVYRGTSYLGKAVADSTGSFKVSIKPQKKDKMLSVHAKDAAGNTSGKRSVKVY
ncbi:Ig-like domain-containing protein [Bacillus sp. NEB1478]|uniref:Ig-like domain-containing protein n=1 Tax=Bacillus sp. NEB1478 TaxID=3073816 RepID=UPI002872D889|nr:Ig-like domain-containing protein [Bacillus sp. NEB1478]WNB92511.1 Ig-like domain-containing protein [Bacillus sp. NEB1478]